MGHRTPYAAFVLLVLAMLSCGLPGGAGPATSDALPASMDTPVALETPESPLAISLSRAVSAGMESGVWSEGEGLVLALRALAGETSPDEAFPGASIPWMEGTQVVLRAQLYLADPGRTEQRDELTRLLSVLVPSRETLDRFAEPRPQAANTGKLAIPAARPARQGRVDCQRLWETGFDVGEEDPRPICVRFAEIGISGLTHRVYYPAWWDEEESPQRAVLDPTLEALRTSLETYNAYGPRPVAGTDIVFTDLPLTDRGVEREDVLAAADDTLSERRCRVAVFPTGISLGQREVGEFQQTIAHEIFHCYQMTNLGLGPRAIAPGGLTDTDPAEWWVEGSAEYYGSVVYPSVNAEYQYLDELDRYSVTSGLIVYSYAAYAFFEYLDAQAGTSPEGIIEILRTLPTAGSLDDQQAAAAAIPGMADTFHAFGQAYLDKQLVDLSGAPMPVHPDEGDPWRYPIGSHREQATVYPLVLQRYRMSLADHARYTISQETEGTGHISARPASAPGAWSQIPNRVNTACDESELVVLITSVVPPGEEEAAVTVSATGEEVAEDQPCDECVIGMWTLDNSSYLAHMGAEWPIIQAMLPMFGLDTGGATVSPTEVFGSMSLTFEGEGVVKGEQSGWGIAGIVTSPDGTLSARIAYNGAAEGTWHIQEDDTGELRFVVFDDTTFSLTGQMTVDRFALAPMNTGGTNDSAFLGTPQRFVCQGDILTFGPDDPQGPLVFQRAAPSEGP